MLWRPPSSSRLTRGVPWTREAYRVAAVINSVLAVLALILAWRVPFPEKLDFDMSGLLYVVTSLPAIGAWVVFLALALCAAYCWVRMTIAPPRRVDPWS